MFGLVLAEAMSYGLPIVAPNHAAIPEAAGLESGVLYEPGDLDECVRAIREVTRSRNRWMELSSGAKAFAEQRYAHDYMGKYAQLLLSCTHLGDNPIVF
jgi:glycosyltransferase involved in cell wall biosynthesis